MDELADRPAPVGSWRDYPPIDLTRIHAAALAQIVEHGYEAASVRAIAREVGVTVPALYYHVENKQALLVDLLDYGIGTVTEHIDDALHEAGDEPVDRLRALVEAIVLYVTHHQDLAFLDSEIRSLTPDNRRRYVAKRDYIESTLSDIIAAGRATGSFRTETPHECTRAILSMCLGVATWFDASGPLTPAELARRYVGIALAAVEYRDLEAGNRAR